MTEETEPPRFATHDDLWQPPQDSLATRAISKRSKASGRSTAMTPDNREIRFESLLEKKVAMRLMTSKQVARLVEQPPPVVYFDADGVQCLHYFDFLATMHDGRKIAYAIRPEHRAAKIRALLPFLMPYAVDLADGFVVATEKHVPRASVANAALILSARRAAHPGNDQAVRTVVAGLHGQVTVGDIVAMTGLHGDGFRAVIRAIDRGELAVTTGGAIDYATRIERVHNHGDGQ